MTFKKLTCLSGYSCPQSGAVFVSSRIWSGGVGSGGIELSGWVRSGRISLFGRVGLSWIWSAGGIGSRGILTGVRFRLGGIQSCGVGLGRIGSGG